MTIWSSVKIFYCLISFMETLEEIFRPNGFIEKSAVWPAGDEPVRGRIIFGCVPTNCDDAAERTVGNLGFDPVIRHT